MTKIANPFYKSPEWLALRAEALKRDRHTCTTPGCSARATHVDHIESRPRGAQTMTAADTLSNLRSLCASHDSQVRERPDGSRPRGGNPYAKGCGADGFPISPDHPWSKR